MAVMLKLWLCCWYLSWAHSAVVPRHLPLPDASLGYWRDAYDSIMSAPDNNYDLVGSIPYFAQPVSYYPSAAEREFNIRAMRYPPYDLGDLYEASETDSLSNNYLDYLPTGFNQQDVVNFQKNLQHYFAPSKNLADNWNAYEEMGTSDLTGVDQGDGEIDEGSVYNDEEAAQQLHSLLPPRSFKSAGPKTAVQEVQKKRALPTVGTSTAQSTTSATKPKGGQSSFLSSGQKEEVMLRPPAPSRKPVAPASPSAQASKNDRTNSPQTLVESIKRLIDLRNQVQVSFKKTN